MEQRDKERVKLPKKRRRRLRRLDGNSVPYVAAAVHFIERRGVVLESARDSTLSNLADEVLGTDLRGSWWGHARGKEFFGLTRRVRAHPDVLVCRLVQGKITYVHRRLWPALLRLAPTLGAERVAVIREIHTASGAHRIERTRLRRWLPAGVADEAARLPMSEARRQLGLAEA